MPNWCRNELRITPSDWVFQDPEVEEFLEAIRETVADYKARIERWKAELKKDKRSPYEVKPSKRGVFDFNNFIPYPENFEQQDNDARTLTPEEFAAKYPPDKGDFPKDGYNTGGYEWCIANWGTKWGASEVVWVPEHMTLYFMTAWGPAFPIISEIHKRFPHFTLNYEYYEKGMGFMGGCEYVPEKWWETDMIPKGKEHEIEMAMKKDGKPPEFKWEAGQAYNFWEQKYLGFKGG